MRQLLLDVDAGSGRRGSMLAASGVRWTKVVPGAHPGRRDDPERGWRPGGHILIDLPDGRTARCRVVNVKHDGTIRVVPEHAIVIGTA